MVLSAAQRKHILRNRGQSDSGLKTASYLNTVLPHRRILPVEGMWEKKQEDNIQKAKVLFWNYLYHLLFFP